MSVEPNGQGYPAHYRPITPYFDQNESAYSCAIGYDPHSYSPKTDAYGCPLYPCVYNPLTARPLERPLERPLRTGPIRGRLQTQGPAGGAHVPDIKSLRRKRNWWKKMFGRRFHITFGRRQRRRIMRRDPWYDDDDMVETYSL